MCKINVIESNAFVGITEFLYFIDCNIGYIQSNSIVISNDSTYENRNVYGFYQSHNNITYLDSEYFAILKNSKIRFMNFVNSYVNECHANAFEYANETYVDAVDIHLNVFKKIVT